MNNLEKLIKIEQEKHRAKMKKLREKQAKEQRLLDAKVGEFLRKTNNDFYQKIVDKLQLLRAKSCDKNVDENVTQTSTTKDFSPHKSGEDLGGENHENFDTNNSEARW